MKLLTYLILFVIAVFGVVFAILNATIVEINYFVGAINIPLSLLLVLTLGLGILIGWLAATIKTLFQVNK